MIQDYVMEVDGYPKVFVGEQFLANDSRISAAKLGDAGIEFIKYDIQDPASICEQLIQSQSQG